MIIKSTRYNYGSTLIHVSDLGICFVGEPQKNDNPEGSRWVYPIMAVSTGEYYDVEPHELIGAYLFDNIKLGFGKRELK